jgi:hypothetical protein
MLSSISPDRIPLLLQKYSKLPNDKLDQIEDIADEVLSGVVSSSAFPLVSGLAMGFGVSSISGIPIVGAAAGFYFIYNAVNGAIQKGKDAEYIKDKGILAHALKEPELVRYAEIIGPDAAVSEVLQAYQDGQTITAAARKLCIAMGKTPKRRSIATFMEDIKQLQDLPIESGIVGALPGTLQTIATAPTIAGGNCKIRTAVDDMINPVRSSYVAAPPRTGKGILIVLAMIAYKRKHPMGSLYGYTPKQDAKEHWYWETCDQFFNPDLDQNPTRAAQSLYSMIRHWQSLPSSPDAPILFVLDELSSTLSRLKPVKMSEVDDELFTDDKRSFSVWLMDFLIHEASMRQSVDRFVWVLTPLATIDGTGVSSSALKSLRNYTLASRENLKFANGGNGSFEAPKISSDFPLFNRYQTIAYSHDSQSWLPIPTVSSDELSKRSASTPKLKMWGEIPAVVGDATTWGIGETISEVFTRAYTEAFVQPIQVVTEPESFEHRVWVWAWQKLTRFPEGKTMRELWNDAPKSITTETDRFTFDGLLRTAIDVGFLIETDDRLTHNPEMQP